MAYVAVLLAGGLYTHTDLTLSAQNCVNYWPQRQDAGNEKSPFIIESFAGLKAFATGAGTNRGIFEHQDTLYKLNGTTLSSVNSSGTFTTLGTIAGASRAVFSGNGSLVVITADGVAYTTDGATVTTATDVDFETPQTNTTINSQTIYDGDGGRIGVSDVGLPLSINGLNYGTAEFKADDTQRPFAFGTIVYVFGDKTVEQWWNHDGNANPPFTPIQDGTIEIGLGARDSVANDDDGVYFFADDNNVYYLLGGVATPLLPKMISREIKAFPRKDDAVGWCMQLDTQWFYVLKFPSSDKTFIYPKGGEWFELSSGVIGGRYNGDGYAFAFGKHLIADETGNILELDIDTFDENSSLIKRVRTLSPISGALFGQPGKEIEISTFKLIGKTGTGILSGQGSDPKVILQYSSDGENFSTEIWGNVGKLGRMTEIIFEINQSFETWVFRLSSTDPVYSSWHSAGIEMNIAI